MKRALLALLVITGAGVAAQMTNPPGFRHWSSVELKRYTQTLPAKMGPQKAITEGLQRYDRVYFAMVHREASSQGEAHRDVSDTYIVQTGTATLVVGGEIVGAQVSPAGEVRGSRIKNGTSSRLLPGDIAHIPAGMNHQILIDSGGQVTYAIIKITSG
jgi:mannose-6-phosphate isomerase-like protein (cupin superfamily)